MKNASGNIADVLMINSLFRVNKKLPIFRSGKQLQFLQVQHGLDGAGAAHLPIRAQTAADHRAQVAAEYAAAVVLRQLDAASTGRLAAFHAGDR